MYFGKPDKERLMKFNKSYLIVGSISLIVLLIIGLAFVWPQWGRKPSTLEKKCNQTHALEQNVLMGMVIKVPGSEPNSYWELKVDQFTEQKKIGKMTKVKGDYLLNGKPFYHVNAQGGEINWLSRQLRFTQKVEFSSVDGKRLVAQELLWDPVHKRVTAEREVQLSVPGFRIFTEKITANLALKKVTFIGATRLIYQNQSINKPVN
jgi:LPS export ABC transporter protein LptC